MTATASQIISLTIVYSTVYSGADQRKHEAQRHWPLWGNSLITGEFPAQMAGDAENVSIWWRHHKISSKFYTNRIDNVSLGATWHIR